MNEIFINKTIEKENMRINEIKIIVDNFIKNKKLDVSLNNFINKFNNAVILNIDLRNCNYNYNDKESYVTQINNNNCVQQYGTSCKDIIEKITSAFATNGILVNVTYAYEWYEGPGFLDYYDKYVVMNHM